jgi:hypothetical protein
LIPHPDLHTQKHKHKNLVQVLVDLLGLINPLCKYSLSLSHIILDVIDFFE